MCMYVLTYTLYVCGELSWDARETDRLASDAPSFSLSLVGAESWMPRNLKHNAEEIQFPLESKAKHIEL